MSEVKPKMRFWASFQPADVSSGDEEKVFGVKTMKQALSHLSDHYEWCQGEGELIAEECQIIEGKEVWFCSPCLCMPITKSAD